MHLSYNRFNGASFAKQLHVQRECSSVNITNKETVRVKLRTIMQEDVKNITCESESSNFETKGIELRYILYVLYKAAIDISIEEAGRFPLPGLRLHFTDHNLMSFINEIRNLG